MEEAFFCLEVLQLLSGIGALGCMILFCQAEVDFRFHTKLSCTKNDLKSTLFGLSKSIIGTPLLRVLGILHSTSTWVLASPSYICSRVELPLEWSYCPSPSFSLSWPAPTQACQWEGTKKGLSVWNLFLLWTRLLFFWGGGIQRTQSEIVQGGSGKIYLSEKLCYGRGGWDVIKIGYRRGRKIPEARTRLGYPSNRK